MHVPAFFMIDLSVFDTNNYHFLFQGKALFLLNFFLNFSFEITFQMLNVITDVRSFRRLLCAWALSNVRAVKNVYVYGAWHA